MTDLPDDERRAVEACPFCGETTAINYVNDTGPAMRCGRCKAEGPVADDRHVAAIRWNRRAESAEIARLKARLHAPCSGCPGCGSNDCPDAVDVRDCEIARLREALREAGSRIDNLRSGAEASGHDTTDDEAFVARIDALLGGTK